MMAWYCVLFLFKVLIRMRKIGKKNQSFGRKRSVGFVFITQDQQ